MSLNGNGVNGVCGGDQWFVKHLQRFIGETVLVFATCGGASGNGFSGVLMEVNCDFIRLVNRQSSPPTCPISNICNGEEDYCRDGNGVMGESAQYEHMRKQGRNVGSICDIPIDRIAAFCHNAV
jgi:hypothetical protein